MTTGRFIEEQEAMGPEGGKVWGRATVKGVRFIIGAIWQRGDGLWVWSCNESGACGRVADQAEAIKCVVQSHRTIVREEVES